MTAAVARDAALARVFEDAFVLCIESRGECHVFAHPAMLDAVRLDSDLALLLLEGMDAGHVFISSRDWLPEGALAVCCSQASEQYLPGYPYPVAKPGTVH